MILYISAQKTIAMTSVRKILWMPEIMISKMIEFYKSP